MQAKSKNIKYGAEIFTGARPTGNLTVANYLGAVKPIIELQNEGYNPLIFVADLHALTDYEPKIVKKFINEIVADYLALGIDSKKTRIFLQSDIEEEVAILTILLARHTNVSELLRVPTLKDKLKANARPETANALLFLYPIMMAADILLQRAKKVPVGEDQLAHIEIARELAKRFNKKYKEIFPLPQALEIKAQRILSLKGEGKMSKSLPDGAIFLTDNLKIIAKKISRAETAFEGVMNEKLKSHILIAKGLCKNKSEEKEIDEIIKRHKQGEKVMGEFKKRFAIITQNFLKEFQEKREKIINNPKLILSVLEDGKKIAKANARETINLVKEALYKD